jgi:uncharacterized protein (UPF0332 family)
MVDRLLEIADLLINEDGRSSAFRRRAVSTAYYAVFHALAKICADELMPTTRSSEEYSRVYRALEHGTLKSAFLVKDSPLKVRPNLRTIGDTIVRLQSERHRADYLPPVSDVFTRRKAEELIEQARTVVDEITSLDEPDRRALAAYLLFKNRVP